MKSRPPLAALALAALLALLAGPALGSATQGDLATAKLIVGLK